MSKCNVIRETAICVINCCELRFIRGCLDGLQINQHGSITTSAYGIKRNKQSIVFNLGQASGSLGVR